MNDHLHHTARSLFRRLVSVWEPLASNAVSRAVRHSLIEA